MTQLLQNKSILLVISGGIAAYKSLELIRLIRKSGGMVRCILTSGGAQFVTPLSLSALSENEVYTDLWSLKNETEMGHIRLSREADIIIVAPASADIIAKMTHGMANDLATTVLLAADKPIMIAPAMNHMMWENAATQDNIRVLGERGITLIGPEEGDMACGEHGMGRMSEPDDILDAIISFFHERPLKGYKALVTSGPTYEAIDPVRFIGNRSSGKQGHAIASALAFAGADVTLVSGPTALPDPVGVNTIHIENAAEMMGACEEALPCDIVVCASAVSDWAPSEPQAHKIKKRDDQSAPTLNLKENPDILASLSSHKQRPTLVIGFAAESENLLENAKAKIKRKGCDWLLANDISGENTFGSDKNHVYLLKQGLEPIEWPKATKSAIASKLVNHIIEQLEENDRHHGNPPLRAV